MNTKPRNEIAGPTTMRRVLKISGLNCSWVVLPPSISRNPATIIRADAPASIPMFGEIGSLNVSVAAGVMMYEVVRQRLLADMDVI